jgi:hypothetical protein
MRAAPCGKRRAASSAFSAAFEAPSLSSDVTMIANPITNVAAPSSKIGIRLVHTDQFSIKSQFVWTIKMEGVPAASHRWRLIKLTATQEITPYKWAHPDEER